jgi:hypothetical protein
MRPWNLMTTVRRTNPSVCPHTATCMSSSSSSSSAASLFTFPFSSSTLAQQQQRQQQQTTYGKITESTKRSAAEQEKDRERPYPAPSTAVDRRTVGPHEWHCVQPRMNSAVYMYVHYQLKQRGFRPFYVVEADQDPTDGLDDEGKGTKTIRIRRGGSDDYQLCTEKDKVSELQGLLAQYIREFQTGNVDVFVYKIPVTPNMKAVIEWTWDGGLQTDAYSIRAPHEAKETQPIAAAAAHDEAWIKSGAQFPRWYRALRKLQRDEHQQAWVDLPIDKIAVQTQTKREDLFDWCVPFLAHTRVDAQRLQVPMNHYAASIQSLFQCGARIRVEEGRRKKAKKEEDEDGFGVLDDDEAAPAEDDPLWKLTASTTGVSAQGDESKEDMTAMAATTAASTESKEQDNGSGLLQLRELPADIQTNVIQPIVAQVGLLVPAFASQSALLQASVLDPLPSASARVMSESDLTLRLTRSAHPPPRLLNMTPSTSFPLATHTHSSLATSTNVRPTTWTAREVMRLSPRDWLCVSDSEALQVSRSHSLVLRYAQIHTRQPVLTGLWLVLSDDAYRELMDRRLGPIVQQLRTWLSNESTSPVATYELRQTGSVSLKVFERLAPFVFSLGAITRQPGWVPNEWFGLYHLLQRPILDSVDAICQSIRKDSRELLARPDSLSTWLSLHAPWCSIPRVLPVWPQRTSLRYAGVLSIRRLTEGPMFSIAGSLVDDGDPKEASPEPFFDLVRMANGRMFLLPRAEAFQLADPPTAQSIQRYADVLHREGRALGSTAPHYLARFRTDRPDQLLRYDKDKHLLELDGTRMDSWHWTTWSEEEPLWFDPFDEWMATPVDGSGEPTHWMSCLTNNEEFLTLLRSVVRFVLSFIRTSSEAYVQRLCNEFLNTVLLSSGVLPTLAALTDLCPSSRTWCQRVEWAYVLLLSSSGSTPSSQRSRGPIADPAPDLFNAQRIKRACALMDALHTLPWFLHFAANEPLPAILCEQTTSPSVSASSSSSSSSMSSATATSSSSSSSSSSASSAVSKSSSIPTTKGV